MDGSRAAAISSFTAGSLEYKTLPTGMLSWLQLWSELKLKLVSYEVMAG